MKLLSTKVLSEELTRKLKSHNIDLYQYDAISIEHSPENMPESIEHAIVTSQNAAEAISWSGSKIKYAYCVGEKTAAACKQLGAEVKIIAPAASILGQLLARDFSQNAYTYLCGNMRLNSLPNKLKESGVALEEITVYKTILNKRGYASAMDLVLFFSPSGVEAFAAGNRKEGNEIASDRITKSALCIGRTTAKAAEAFFEDVHVSSSTSIENVVEEAIEFKKNLKK